MFFKKRHNIIFRNYNTFGYIIDNRLFGYAEINRSDVYVGDKILSQSGSVFFSVLDIKPKSLNALTNEINKIFVDGDIQAIKNDACEFYSMLELDGFVVSGETVQECEEKDRKYSYNILATDFAESDVRAHATRHKTSTQDFFDEHFGGMPQLTNLHIEITNRCNERCIHCYIPHKRRTGYIDSDLFYDVLEQCININVLHLTLTGGEPLLHMDFCDFLKKCREYNFSINVLSNLTLLDDAIIKEMKQNPLLSVQASLYSMNPDIHDKITKLKGSFERTKNGILKIIDNHIPIQISCPIMKQNKFCYNDVVKWANNYNIIADDDYIVIAGCDHTGSNLSCRLSTDELEAVINDKAHKDKNYFVRLEMEAERKRDSRPDNFVCSVCNSSICIAEDGNVYPCAGWRDYVVGNVNESTLSDIWNSAEKVTYLRALRMNDFPKCIKCAEREFCTMCMVRNANENRLGDPLAVSEYFCQIAKINKKMMLGWKSRSAHASDRP